MPRPALLLIVVLTAVAAGTAGAHAKTVWLCKPGMKHDPCTPSLKTTVFSATGHKQGVKKPATAKHPKIDCFYLYPTVSDQPGLQANLHIDPIERSIALYQAAYYSSQCRVFAPMYRELTLSGIVQPNKVTPQMRATEFGDVQRAWREYLRRFNHGRGVVLIGHSQGSFELRELISREIDRKPSERRHLVSALLLGGNVLVKKGSDVGGDFKHVRACHSRAQLGCVVAYSTFNGPVPQNSLFGRTAVAGDQVLCTNPATLSSRTGSLDAIFPTTPLAPGTIASISAGLVSGGLPTASTPWLEFRGSYRARCSSAGGASVLQVTGVPGARQLNPVPDATWGLHFADPSIALGNLVSLVRSEAAAYLATHP